MSHVRASAQSQTSGKTLTCRYHACDRNAVRNGYCIQHSNDFPGRGVIVCAACGGKVRDHSLPGPCPQFATPTGWLR